MTTTPADTYFNYQWHLSNTGQNGATAGVDIDITRIWDEYKGSGISIGIIDDGFDLSHPDLAANYNTTKDYDYRRNDTTPAYESGDAHGTTVAGVIAADDNGIGMVGVAPDATISGLRVSFSADSTLAMFENAMLNARNFDIVNNSWGFTGMFSDDFTQSYMATMKTALQNAVMYGRGGLGTNIVFAAGNAATSGDNVNYHNMSNSPFAIAVGAITKNGVAASFSTPGAAVLVSAPGAEIYTTDNTGTAGFVSGDYVGVSGTSFAAPIVSGVIALMLEANAKLGYRDVQEILAYSARKIDTEGGNWQTNGATNWNGTGLHFSHQYGYGLVDAHTAVRLAESWGTGTGTFATLDTQTVYNYTAVPIPDGSAYASSTISITSDILVDRVEVVLDITHALASQLEVVLVSPHGTQSLLFDNAATTTFPVFVFNTVANWGESSLGDWTIKVYDQTAGGTGTLNAWAINIMGDTATADNRYVFTDEFVTTATSVYSLNDTNGGTDIFNASALSTAVSLDLTARTGSIGGRAISITKATSLETVYGGDGNDTFTGNNTANTIHGGRGDDVINGNGSNDTLHGQAGNDTISGGTGTDYVYGGAGDDTLLGNDGYDRLYGGLGHDIIEGNAGNDKLYGEAGDDTLSGGAGLDYLYGGNGHDTYIIDTIDGNMDRLYDFSLAADEADTLDLSALLENYEAGDSIASFLRFTVSGADTNIRVNTDGQGSDYVTVARIYGLALTDTVQHYLDTGMLAIEQA